MKLIYKATSNSDPNDSARLGAQLRSRRERRNGPTSMAIRARLPARSRALPEAVGDHGRAIAESGRAREHQQRRGLRLAHLRPTELDRQRVQHI